MASWMGEIRISTYDNPLGLKLGERIQARRTCVVDYEGNNRKIICSRDFESPVSMVVVGSVKKATGVRIEGSFSDGIDGDDYVPPYLATDKYHWLYECRQTMSQKSVLVRPDDVVMEDEQCQNK